MPKKFHHSSTDQQQQQQHQSPITKQFQNERNISTLPASSPIDLIQDDHGSHKKPEIKDQQKIKVKQNLTVTTTPTSTIIDMEQSFPKHHLGDSY